MQCAPSGWAYQFSSASARDKRRRQLLLATYLPAEGVTRSTAKRDRNACTREIDTCGKCGKCCNTEVSVKQNGGRRIEATAAWTARISTSFWPICGLRWDNNLVLLAALSQAQRQRSAAAAAAGSNCCKYNSSNSCCWRHFRYGQAATRCRAFSATATVDGIRNEQCMS